MCLVLNLLFFVLFCSPCSAFWCDQNRAGECVCEINHGKYRVFCPSRDSRKKLHILWHEDFKTRINHLELTCSNETHHTDILGYLRSLQFHKIDILDVIKCPVVGMQFITEINATGVTELMFSQSIQEQREVWPSFAGSDNVTKLSISYQRNLVLGEESFASLKKLKYLNLRGNKGLEMGDLIFSSLYNLEELDLSSCDLHTLSRDLFHNLSKLKSLNLYSNKLTSLQAGILSSLSLLDILNLNRNRLAGENSDIQHPHQLHLQRLAQGML